MGALAVPTFQRIFSRAVEHFQVHRSIPKLLLHGFARGGLSYIRDSVTVPSANHLTGLRKEVGAPVGVIVLNIAAQALFTVGKPSPRSTPAISIQEFRLRRRPACLR